MSTSPLWTASSERPKPVSVEVANTPLGKRFVFLNGKATPLFWAYELKDAKHLEDYKKSGFNTVYVDVLWGPPERAEKSIEAARQLAKAAEAQGLFVIYGVECVPPATPAHVRIAPEDEEYVRPLKEWIKFIVEELGDTPNLIGWGTPHAPTSTVADDDVGFQRWLKDTYKTEEELNQAWGTQGAGFNVTRAEAVELDADGRPGGIGEPTVDVGLYRWTTFTRLMQLWASLIRQHDRRRLLVTGRLHDYKSIISVPDNYDVVVPAVYPTYAEPDVEAHNAHAVDMARQANQFVAVPALLTQGAGGVLTRRAAWMNEMAMHGASGIAFQDWNDFVTDAGARGDVSRVIAHLTRTPLLTALPTPTIAMLYEPIAEGAMIGGKTLYGFGPGISLEEPNYLFASFRRGTRYGQVDYLSHDALSRADLRRYAVLCAPLAFYLAPSAQTKLTEFVAGGGILIADLGVGMVQSGGDLRFMPQALQDLFGVYGITRFADLERNLVVIAEHALFPSLNVNDSTTGALRDGFTFSPPMGFVRRYPDAVNVGMLVHGTRGARAQSVTLGVYPFGQGFAIYAPFRLWAHWLPSCQLYQEFHGDLFRRDALVALFNSSLLTPLTMDPMGPNVPAQGAEVGTTLEGATAFNPLPRAQLVRFETVGVQNLLFGGAADTSCLVTTYTRGNVLIPSSTHQRLGTTEFAAMIGNPQPTIAMLNDVLPPGALRDYRFLPIQLVPLTRSASGQVVEYSRDRVQINLWMDVANVALDPENADAKRPNVTAVGVRDGSARLTLMTGDYVIPPSSQHRVTITPLGSRRNERLTLTANDHGLLVIERKWKAHTGTIEPAGKEEKTGKKEEETGEGSG